MNPDLARERRALSEAARRLPLGEFCADRANVLRGTVLTSDGHPESGARVSLFCKTARERFGRPEAMIGAWDAAETEVEADTMGSFALTPLSYGPKALIISSRRTETRMLDELTILDGVGGGDIGVTLALAEARSACLMNGAGQPITGTVAAIPASCFIAWRILDVIDGACIIPSTLTVNGIPPLLLSVEEQECFEWEEGSPDPVRACKDGECKHYAAREFLGIAQGMSPTTPMRPELHGILGFEGDLHAVFGWQALSFELAPVDGDLADRGRLWIEGAPPFARILALTNDGSALYVRASSAGEAVMALPSGNVVVYSAGRNGRAAVPVGWKVRAQEDEVVQWTGPLQNGTGAIHGFVREEGKDPGPAWVFYARVGGYWQRTDANEAGHYSIANITGGRYLLFACRKNEARTYRAVEQVSLSEDALLRLDHVLHTGSIELSAVREHTVLIQRDGGSLYDGVRVAVSNAKTVVTNVPPGKYVVRSERDSLLTLSVGTGCVHVLVP